MANILLADWESGQRVTATVPTANSLPIFPPGVEIYRKSEMIVSAPATSKSFEDSFKPWIVVRWAYDVIIVIGVTKYKDADGVEAVSALLPVNPDATGPGNRTVPQHLVLIRAETGEEANFVPVADCLEHADAKIYFAAQIGNL